MKLSEIINNCEDIARVMEKVDKYITNLEEKVQYLESENERLEEIIERHAIQYE